MKLYLFFFCGNAAGGCHSPKTRALPEVDAVRRKEDYASVDHLVLGLSSEIERMPLPLSFNELEFSHSQSQSLSSFNPFLAMPFCLPTFSSAAGVEVRIVCCSLLLQYKLINIYTMQWRTLFTEDSIKLPYEAWKEDRASFRWCPDPLRRRNGRPNPAI